MILLYMQINYFLLKSHSFCFQMTDIKKENDLCPLPKGTIVMFNGTEAPLGWKICDGSEGTPDLRGKFVLGAGQGLNLTERKLNQSGGEEKHTLQLAEMPPHTHVYQYNPLGGGNMSPHAFGHEIVSTGQAQPHNIMPPHWVLTYIMKL